MQGPSKEGNAAKAGPGAAPLQEGPAAVPCVDERGGEVLSGLVCGAECCGSPPTLHSIRLRSRTRRTAPDRSGDTKTTASVLRDGTHRDTCGRPRSGVRGYAPRASLDGRQRESQFSHVLQRMKGVLMRMERQLAATAAHALLPVR
jgi:hypothetical protein